MSAPPEPAKAALAPTPPFEYAPSLQEYMVSEEEFLRQNPQYNVLVTGIVVFNSEGKMLLVQRATDESAFPEFWEIPGGKVDEPDETLLHAAARELKEETGLTATKMVRKVGEFGWIETNKRTGLHTNWLKHVFEVGVESWENVVLDPVEHQKYLWASEEEIKQNRAGEVVLKWITLENKEANLEAFRKQREG